VIDLIILTWERRRCGYILWTIWVRYFQVVEKYLRCSFQFNAYKNKAFHSGYKNLPIVDAVLNTLFLYPVSNNKLQAHPEGEVFVNEGVYNLLILNLFIWAESVLKRIIAKAGGRVGKHKRIDSRITRKITPFHKKGIIYSRCKDIYESVRWLWRLIRSSSR